MNGRFARRTLAGTLLVAAALAAMPASSARSQGTRRLVTYPTRTMGTYANVTLATADSAASAPLAHLAHLELWRLDSLMTNWTTTSEVARINRVAGAEPTVVQPEVAEVIDRSLRLWQESDGAFDITVEPLVRLWGFLGGPKRVPSEEEVQAAFRRVGSQRVHFDRATRVLRFDNPGVKIDLGGIAKGYAVDAAARALRDAGVTSALVDLPGNMFAIGAPDGADHWRIGVRDPRGRMPYFARLDLFPGEAISTSGKYEQFVAQDGRTYGHILDARTGRPAEGLISVTVVSHSAFTCDAWDTPLFVLGAREACRKAKAHGDIAAILVAPGPSAPDTVYVEASLVNRFTIEPAARDSFLVVPF